MGGRRTIEKLLREPILHFLGLGVLLFLAQAIRGRESGEDLIVVHAADVERLEAGREGLLMRPITAEEREEMVADYIDEEILVREAYRAGLDRGDPRIRQWLVEKMLLLLDPEPPEPTRGELEAWFRENGEQYQVPASVSFDHVFFSSPPAFDGEVLLGRLRRGADFSRMGDDFWLGRSLRGMTEKELSSTLGEDFASEVMALPAGEWRGPLASLRGTHFVRVTERQEPRALGFEEVSWAVRDDFLSERREKSLERELAELRVRYRIERK